MKVNFLMTYIFKNWLTYYFPKSIILTGTENPKKSRSPRRASFLRKDPLTFPFKPRPGVGINLLDTAEFIQKKENAKWIGMSNVPLLVLHGSDDNVTRSSMSLKMV